MNITVKWGRERFHFLTARENTTLGDLRSFVAEQTSLTIGSFKLIFAGGIMKDDSAPLTAYGISQGNTITVIGSHDNTLQTPSKAFSARSEGNTEQSCIRSIENELSTVNQSLRPSLEAFLKDKPQKQVDFDLEHRRLGELLLQSLLRLDALAPESHWSEARLRRKDAVREIQGMLSNLDSAAQRDSGH